MTEGIDNTLVMKAVERTVRRRRAGQYPDMRALRLVTKALNRLRNTDLRLAVLEMAKVRVLNWDQLQPNPPTLPDAKP